MFFAFRSSSKHDRAVRELGSSNIKGPLLDDFEKLAASATSSARGQKTTCFGATDAQLR